MSAQVIPFPRRYTPAQERLVELLERHLQSGRESEWLNTREMLEHLPNWHFVGPLLAEAERRVNAQGATP